jgi:hypothetical protein
MRPPRFNQPSFLVLEVSALSGALGMGVAPTNNRHLGPREPLISPRLAFWWEQAIASEEYGCHTSSAIEPPTPLEALIPLEALCENEHKTRQPTRLATRTHRIASLPLHRPEILRVANLPIGCECVRLWPGWRGIGWCRFRAKGTCRLHWLVRRRTSTLHPCRH